MSAELAPPRARGPGLATSTRWQPVEELPHPRRQHLGEPLERVGQVALKRCAGDGLEDVSAQIQRTEFRQREAGVDPLEHLTVETPLDVAVVIALVVEREAGLLQRREVASDRTRRDLELLGQRVDRRPMTR